MGFRKKNHCFLIEEVVLETINVFKGGIIGLLAGTIFNAWVTIGQLVVGRNYKELKFEGSTENCTHISNLTSFVNISNQAATSQNK